MEYIEENINSDDLGEEQFVSMIAASIYARRVDDTVPFEDYKQYGLIGYLEAKKNYDPDRGVAFKTFAAYRIKGAILNGIAKCSEQLSFYSYKRRSPDNQPIQTKIDNTDADFDDFAQQVLDLIVEDMLGNFFLISQSVFKKAF